MLLEREAFLEVLAGPPGRLILIGGEAGSAIVMRLDVSTRVGAVGKMGNLTDEPARAR